MADPNPYESPQTVTTVEDQSLDSAVTKPKPPATVVYLVASVGALLVLVGSWLVLQSIVGTVMLLKLGPTDFALSVVISVPLALLAAASSFRATIMRYRK